MNNQLATRSEADSQLANWNRVSEVCKQIVLAASCQIDGKRYVKVEGWQALAAMGQLTPEIIKVEQVEMEDPFNAGETMRGVRATAVLKRDSDGYELSRAQGFCSYGETLTKRDGSVVQRWHDQYAVESMAQTRAISKVCRNKLAFVIVMMNTGLQTTPAEEVPPTGFQNQGQPKGMPQAQDGTVTLTGVAENAYEYPAKDNQGNLTGVTVYNVEINGRKLWTKENALGADIQDCLDQETTVQYRPSKNKPNVGQLLNIQSVEQVEPQE